ncbi:MAG: hypothetical protein JXA94_06015 [Parachlamydiales bacterium]|nr:hypothetical protein [Parachlamydiales bacterium]
MKFKKIIFSMIGVFSIVSISAQNQKKTVDQKCTSKKIIEMGYPLEKNQSKNIYNAPASIDVCGSWDVFVSGSFILWQAKENCLQLGKFTPTIASDQVSTVNMDFDFAPGFKVGLGFNTGFDGWNTYLEYVRLQSTSKEDYNSLPEGVAHINSPWIPIPLTNIQGKWKIEYNMADFELSRPYYNGTKLTINPLFGFRGGAIDQKFEVSTNGALGRSTSNFKNDSWLIGGRAGIYSNYLLGYGVKIVSKVATSLNYQRFKTSILFINANDPSLITKILEDKIGLFSPNLDLNIGFGWGTYFDHNNWHFNLLALYDAVFWWNQNEIENLRSTNNLSDGEPSSLFLHGLTVTIKFDF